MREVRTEARKRRERRKKQKDSKQTMQIGGRRLRKSEPEKVSLIKERAGYKPKQSGWLGHMFPITSD